MVCVFRFLVPNQPCELPVDLLESALSSSGRFGDGLECKSTERRNIELYYSRFDVWRGEWSGYTCHQLFSYQRLLHSGSELTTARTHSSTLTIEGGCLVTCTIPKMTSVPGPAFPVPFMTTPAAKKSKIEHLSSCESSSTIFVLTSIPKFWLRYVLRTVVSELTNVATIYNII